MASADWDAARGAFGPRAGEIAAELAVHFAQGRDYDRAVPYLQHAAEVAAQRQAHREAIAYVRRALGLLHAMAETPPRLRRELALQVVLGPALMVTQGFAAPEVADTYGRARQLCEHLGETALLGSLWAVAVCASGAVTDGAALGNSCSAPPKLR
jgi:adenylate cyclase